MARCPWTDEPVCRGRAPHRALSPRWAVEVVPPYLYHNCIISISFAFPFVDKWFVDIFFQDPLIVVVRLAFPFDKVFDLSARFLPSKDGFDHVAVTPRVAVVEHDGSW